MPYSEKNGEVLEPQLNILALHWRTVFPASAPAGGISDADRITRGDGTETSPYAADFKLDSLIKYWNPEWAARFVQFHPEHCKLLACKQDASVDALRWDEKVIKDIYDVAQTSGVQYATSQYSRQPTWLFDADPFFDKYNGLGKDYYDDMKADLEQYTTRVLGMKQGSPKSLPALIDFLIYCAQPGNATSQGVSSWDNCVPLANCRVLSREWRDYRDKYFELKEVYYKRYRDQYCGDIGCPIGTPISVPLPGSFDKTNFSITESKVDAAKPTPACAGAQRIKIVYTKGKPAKAVMLQILYPGLVTPIEVTFTTADSEKYVCIPSNIYPQMITISNIIQ